MKGLPYRQRPLQLHRARDEPLIRANRDRQQPDRDLRGAIGLQRGIPRQPRLRLESPVQIQGLKMLDLAFRLSSALRRRHRPQR